MKISYLQFIEEGDAGKYTGARMNKQPSPSSAVPKPLSPTAKGSHKYSKTGTGITSISDETLKKEADRSGDDPTDPAAKKRIKQRIYRRRIRGSSEAPLNEYKMDFGGGGGDDGDDDLRGLNPDGHYHVFIHDVTPRNVERYGHYATYMGSFEREDDAKRQLSIMTADGAGQPDSGHHTVASVVHWPKGVQHMEYHPYYDDIHKHVLHSQYVFGTGLAGKKYSGELFHDTMKIDFG